MASGAGDPSDARLLPGTEIGTYRVESPIGEGGMGVVYRAQDSKLGRPVAIKFLSSRLADAAARRRFQREAQTTSSLNHPHILTVYDAGVHDGHEYLVTEFVDGGTLKDWSLKVRPSWKPVVELLTGVADGLAAAHAAGILHRDVKPANILLAQNGYAKLADFGLAKLAEGDADATRTVAAGDTSPGVIVGTIGYMAPEQTAGKPVDARTDVFSFGVVLYELLAGRRPFLGKSGLEIIQAIQHASPEPLAESIPRLLHNVVEKALEKDPADRYQSMRELVVDLRRVARLRTTDSGTAQLSLPEAGRSPWPWIIAAAFGALAVVGFWPDAPTSAARLLEGATYSRLTDFEGSENGAAISPNGQFVAFISDRDGQHDVWLTQVEAGTPQNLTGGQVGEIWTELRSIGFSANNSEIWLGGGPVSRMRLLPLVGGSLRNFLTPTTVELDWSPDETSIVYHTRETGDPIFVADSNGTNERLVITAADSQGLHQHYPVWSADGQWVYFVRGWPASVEMDVFRIRPSGEGLERMTFHDGDVSHPMALDDNTLLYLASDGGPRRLWALDVEQRRSRPLSLGLQQFESLDISDDGQRVVVTVSNPRPTLWQVPILDRVAGDADAVPYDVPTVRALAPRFGGRDLFYLSSRDGRDGLWLFDGDEAGEIWRGVDGQLREPAAVSPDGATVAISLRGQGRVRLHVLGGDGAGLRPVAENIDVRGVAAWSPDAQRLVVGGVLDGEQGLFMVPAAGGPAERLVSGQALNPIWSPDGSMIVYLGRDVASSQPIEAITPDGGPIALPEMHVRRVGERVRFLPDGSGFVYLVGQRPTKDFWLYDIATSTSRQLTRFSAGGNMRTFDITPDGSTIVFDRTHGDTDVVLIELPASR